MLKIKMVKDKIVIQNVNKCFGQKKNSNEVFVLDTINCTIKEGEFFVLLGPSGCGKTTLLNILAGFDKPTSGKVFINNKEVIEPNPKYVTMFQEHALFPWRSIYHNIKYGLEIQKINDDEQKKIVEKYINIVGLRGFETHHPADISGGMKQRAQLARTLAVNPEIIFMDEPLGALDHLMRERLQEELITIWEKEKKTIVLITHDISSAIKIADRIAIISPRPGRIKKIIAVNTPRPRNRFSKEFIKIEKEIFQELGLNK